MLDVAASDKNIRSSVRQIEHGLVDCGKRRPDRAGQRGIVKPRNRKLARQIHPAIMRHRKDACRHVIIGSEDCGGRLCQIKQLATGIDKGVQESLFNGIYKPKEMSKTWLNLSELNKEVGTPEEKIKIAARYKRNKDLYEKLFKEMYNGGKQ